MEEIWRRAIEERRAAMNATTCLNPEDRAAKVQETKQELERALFRLQEPLDRLYPYLLETDEALAKLRLDDVDTSEDAPPSKDTVPPKDAIPLKDSIPTDFATEASDEDEEFPSHLHNEIKRSTMERRTLLELFSSKLHLTGRL